MNKKICFLGKKKNLKGIIFFEMFKNKTKVYFIMLLSKILIQIIKNRIQKDENFFKLFSGLLV